MTENKPVPENDNVPEEALTKEQLEAAANALLDEDTGEDAFEMDTYEELATENADLKDRVLRAMADTENLRKRAEREKAEATLYAATNFARDLLSVSDSMAKALEMMPDDARKTADEATRNLVEGIELTRRELLNSFQKHGIVEVDPLDEKFDPNYHQAMFEVPGSDKPNGTVVQVVQTGFKIGERILRPALVGVAKQAAPAEEEKGKKK
jgi:molecular chaperone GrpE